LYINFNPVHDPNAYSPVPARLEAENYNRMSGIAIEATGDISGMANVGWIDAGDWLEYNIDVPTTGNYTVFFRISANAQTNLELLKNNAAIQTLQIPSSGGWQNWRTLQANISLAAGKHQLQLYTNKGMFNLNWLEITHAGQPTPVIATEQANERIYPNPVNDKLFIEMAIGKGTVEVSILDLSGRIMATKVFSGHTPKAEIDFSSFKNGSYIVRTKKSGNISNQLIVK
jgi:hypothetical protein